MKKILIVFKNTKSFILKDNDNTNITTYTKELSKLMEFSNVCILETTEGNVILKPSEISSIVVKEIQQDKMKHQTEIREDVIRD